MKYISVLLLVFAIILSVCTAATITHNGEPGCKTSEEMTVQKYRNNWDPAKYWLCVLRGKPAKLTSCESEHLFQDELKKCVHHTVWIWTEPADPPSRP